VPKKEKKGKTKKKSNRKAQTSIKFLNATSKFNLQVSDMTTTLNANGTLTVSGFGSPIGAGISVSVSFASGGGPFSGSSTVQADGSWTVGPINIGTSVGNCTITATATTAGFTASAVALEHFAVPG
jgi:hypothetical protein